MLEEWVMGKHAHTWWGARGKTPNPSFYGGENSDNSQRWKSKEKYFKHVHLETWRPKESSRRGESVGNGEEGFLEDLRFSQHTL